MVKEFSKERQQKAIKSAIKENNLDELKAILDCIEIDIRLDENNLTVLMLVLEKNQFVLFQELLRLIGKYDFDLDAKDKNGLTIVDYVLRSNDGQIAEALSNAFWYRIVTASDQKAKEIYITWNRFFTRINRLEDYETLEQKKEQLCDFLKNKQWAEAESFVASNQCLMTQPYYPGESPWHTLINELNSDNQVVQNNSLIFLNFLVNCLGDEIYKCNYRDDNGYYWDVIDAIAAKISPEKLRSRSRTSAWEQFYSRFKSAQNEKLLLLFSSSKIHLGSLFKDERIFCTQRIEQRDLIEANYRASYVELTESYLGRINSTLSRKYPDIAIDFDALVSNIQSGLEGIVAWNKIDFAVAKTKINADGFIILSIETASEHFDQLSYICLTQHYVIYSSCQSVVCSKVDEIDKFLEKLQLVRKQYVEREKNTGLAQALSHLLFAMNNSLDAEHDFMGLKVLFKKRSPAYYPISNPINNLVYILAVNAFYLRSLPLSPMSFENLKYELEKLNTQPLNKILVEYNNLSLIYFCLWLSNKYKKHSSMFRNDFLINLSGMLEHFADSIQDDTKIQLSFCCSEVLLAFLGGCHSEWIKLNKNLWYCEDPAEQFNSLNVEEINVNHLLQLGPMFVSNLPVLTSLEQKAINFGLPLNLYNRIPKILVEQKWFDVHHVIAFIVLDIKELSVLESLTPKRVGAMVGLNLTLAESMQLQWLKTKSDLNESECVKENYFDEEIDTNQSQLQKKGVEISKGAVIVHNLETEEFTKNCYEKNWGIVCEKLERGFDLFQSFAVGQSPLQHIILGHDESNAYLNLIKFIAKLLHERKDYNALTYYLADSTFDTFMCGFACNVILWPLFEPKDTDPGYYKEFIRGIEKIQRMYHLMGRLNVPMTSGYTFVEDMLFIMSGITPQMMHEHMLGLLAAFLRDMQTRTEYIDMIEKQHAGLNLDYVNISNKIYDDFAYYLAHNEIDDPAFVFSHLSAGHHVGLEIKTRINYSYHSINLFLVPSGQNGMTIYVADKMSDLMVFYTANRSWALEKIIDFTQTTMDSSRLYHFFEFEGFVTLAKIKTKKQAGWTCVVSSLDALILSITLHQIYIELNKSQQIPYEACIPVAQLLTKIIGFHGIMQDIFQQGGFDDLLFRCLSFHSMASVDYDNLFEAIERRCTYMFTSRQEAANKYLGLDRRKINKLGDNIAYILGPAIDNVEDANDGNFWAIEHLKAKLSGVTEAQLTDKKLVAQYGDLLAYYPLDTLQNLSFAQLAVLRTGRYKPEEIDYPWFNLGSCFCMIQTGVVDPTVLKNITIAQTILFLTMKNSCKIEIKDVVGFNINHITTLAVKRFHLNTHQAISDIRQLLLINGIHAFGLVGAGLTRTQVFRPDFTSAQVAAIFLGDMSYEQAMDLGMKEKKYWRLLIRLSDGIEHQKPFMNVSFKNADIGEYAVYVALCFNLVSIQDLMDIITLEQAKTAAKKSGWTESEVCSERFGVEHVIAIKSGCEGNEVKSLTRNQALFLACSKVCHVKDLYPEPLDIEPLRTFVYIQENSIDSSLLEQLNHDQFFFRFFGWTLQEVTTNEITQTHIDAFLNYGIASRYLIGLDAKGVNDLINQMLKAEQFNAEYNYFVSMKEQILGGKSLQGSFFKHYDVIKKNDCEDADLNTYAMS